MGHTNESGVEMKISLLIHAFCELKENKNAHKKMPNEHKNESTSKTVAWEHENSWCNSASGLFFQSCVRLRMWMCVCECGKYVFDFNMC